MIMGRTSGGGRHDPFRSDVDLDSSLGRHGIRGGFGRATTLHDEKLYEKGVIAGLMGIAFDPCEDQPGDIELQGDHGSVEFRNLVLRV